MNIRNIVGYVFLVAVLVVAGYALADEETEFKVQEAREALNEARYEQAARLFEQVYEMEEGNQEAGNALYWRAFAHYRLQRTQDLKMAAELLRLQQDQYARSETADDGQALLARLYGELAERGEVEGVREIHELSDDERLREATRVAALEALTRMDPDKALPILEQIVTGEKEASADMRRHAVFILCRMDEPGSEDLLIEMLGRTEDPSLLSELVMCLSMKDSEKAMNAIVELFKSNDNPEVDQAAMFAIGRHGGEQAFNMLSEIVRNPDNNIDMRQEALFGITQTGRNDDIIALAMEILKTDTDPQMLEGALFALSHTEGEVPNQVFLDVINNPRADDDLRTQALFFAAEREQLDLEFLEQVYAQAETQDMKRQVCHVITRLDDQEAALEALIAIIRTEDDPEVRQEAVFWVSQFDNEQAAAFLLEVINGD